ncbi:MAG TPA: transglycosylase SLT domain-containing protein [Anaerolineae bacterium]|nr:transglycosylase SLT domain-containing protein [Anaerolineae bacterium]
MRKPAYLTLVVVLLSALLLTPDVRRATADTSSTSSLSSYWGPTIRQWDALIAYYAGQRGLDPDLIASLIYEESHGLPNQISAVGAVGLMQIMPQETGFAWRPKRAELLKPAVNLYWGTRTLGQVIQQAEGSLFRALAAYNGGWEQEHLRATQFFAVKVLDHYARAIAARGGYDAQSLEEWTLVFDIRSSAGLMRVDQVQWDGTVEADTTFDLSELPASTPHATAYSLIDPNNVAWLIEVWVIVKPIEGGTPAGRGTY